LRKGPYTRETLSALISPKVYGLDARKRVRSVFIELSAFSILWIYGLNVLLGRSRLESVIAAGILAGSWEVAYHSRWVAPDVIMMQFALLAFLCLAAGRTGRPTRWFYFGAIAVGLTTGTKYPGGLMLPFFLIGAGESLWRRYASTPSLVFKHLVALTATTGITFLMTTPGALLDPFRFFRQLQEQHDIYASGWFGYSVKPGLSHFFAILQYISLQVFSHYWTISVALAILSLVGFLFIVSERRLFSFLLTAFVLAYVLFFSQQAAMIVRNLLIVVPFFCLAAARGITVVAERVSRMRTTVYSLVALLIAINLGWEVYAALSIKKRNHPEYFLKQFHEYVEKSDSRILLSSHLASAMTASHLSLPPNSGTHLSDFTKVAFLQSEGADKFWEKWPSNSWGLYERNFGPLEVNIEAYTTFVGNERIFVMSADRFRQLPITVKDID